MSEIILKIENLSKQYRLGTVGTGTLSHDLNRWWYKIRGKEDPFLKIGEINDRTTKGTSDYVWALKDIDFEVNRGEVLGIIGKNGAGKSTLLKILSKVTGPTTGSIKSKGRIASLLEVGTGFHPELTGRENIFLNGAILGMTKAEINAKIDEIVEFSGCERYIDTPVKRYSSGMTVRLAFSVAAHLEPDILVVDEVLTVGDAEFQKKAIGKMQDISKGEGRTVLFVSHDMVAIETLCKKTILLNKGNIEVYGNTNDVLKIYLNEFKNSSKNDLLINNPKVIKRIVLNKKKEKELVTGDRISFTVFFDTEKINTLSLGYVIKDEIGRNVLAANTYQYNQKFIVNKGQDKIKILIKRLPLTPGNYSISIYLGNGYYDVDKAENAIFFSLFWDNKHILKPKTKWGVVYAKTKWLYN